MHLQTMEVVMLLMETMQQVPAKVQQLRPLYNQLQLPIVTHRLDTDVDNMSVNILCSLTTLADVMDPEWRRQRPWADGQSLPGCREPSSTAAATLPTAGDNQYQKITLLNGLVDMLQSLRVARCIAEVVAQSADRVENSGK